MLKELNVEGPLAGWDAAPVEEAQGSRKIFSQNLWRKMGVFYIQRTSRTNPGSIYDNSFVWENIFRCTGACIATGA